MDSSEDAVISFRKNYRSQIIINVRADLRNGECRVWEGMRKRKTMESGIVYGRIRHIIGIKDHKGYEATRE